MGSPEVDAVILGCGTSHGVPMIGCHCAVCTSDDPRDRRSRTSCYLRFGGARLLIDAAPELRLQCVEHGVEQVDAVLFTHHHADHVAGLDDLRRFNWLMKREIPCYGSERALRGVQRMFSYAFEVADDSPHSRPRLSLLPITEPSFEVAGARIIPIPMMHGPMPVLGYRFGRFAYCTDCNMISDDSLDLLGDLEVLVLGALRHTPHPAHFTLEEAVAMAGRIGAQRTYFTHTTHQLGYVETNASLPDSMELAFDGLRIAVG